MRVDSKRDSFSRVLITLVLLCMINAVAPASLFGGSVISLTPGTVAYQMQSTDGLIFVDTSSGADSMGYSSKRCVNVTMAQSSTCVGCGVMIQDAICNASNTCILISPYGTDLILNAGRGNPIVMMTNCGGVYLSTPGNGIWSGTTAF